MIRKTVLYFPLILGALAQLYEDKRCRCVCPRPAELFLNVTSNSIPKLYIAYVPPNQCNCVGVILPHIGVELEGREPEYCLRCECKFETRNTAVIKVVVITIIWLLALLIIYSLFLICLDPFIRKQRAQHYRDHGSEEARSLMNGSDEETDRR